MITHECGNKEYAGKGWAALNTALAGVALANGSNGNGLGGILGGGTNAVQNENATLKAENAMLKAENYSDKVAKDVYQQTLADRKELREEFTGVVKPMLEALTAHGQRIATLEAEQKCDKEKADLREQLLRKDIEIESTKRECCCNAMNTALAGIQQVLGNIVKTVIPNTSICPGWGNVTVTPATATT